VKNKPAAPNAPQAAKPKGGAAGVLNRGIQEAK